MAEVMVALGVNSSVISCIETGVKVSDRLEYYLSRTKSPPQSKLLAHFRQFTSSLEAVFPTLHDTIPLLIENFENIKGASEE